MKLDRIRILLSAAQFGFLAYASFLICVLSGMALVFVYDSSSPVDSISLILMLNKPALLIRSLHYWSGQIFIITSLFHVIDHFIKKSEQNQTRTNWFYLVLLIPILLFSDFSGFLLKGDYESRQAANVLTAIIGAVAVIGKDVVYLLIGGTESLKIVEFNHVFTATIIILFLTIYHAKKFLPNIRSLILIIPFIAVLSIILVPPLDLAENMVPKGPWYFVGLQELLHWLIYPETIIFLFILFLASIFIIKILKEKNASRMKFILLFFMIFYSIISLFAIFCRREGWKFTFEFKSNSEYFNFISSSNLIPPDSIPNSAKIPIVNGKRESCVYCHSSMQGLSKSHSVEALGCYSCHLGNPLSLNKDVAHKGMSLTPGNLDVVHKTCGRAECHIGITARVSNSLMTTMTGVVSVDKFAFKEIKSPEGNFHIDKIGNSPAENHLKELCASCHLSYKKQKPGPIDELSRGGGCSACHLHYGQAALNEFQNRQNKTNLNVKIHPEISINISNNSCFGCHSRSGRISTNYEGWHETQYSESDFNKLNKPGFRLMQDGRVFEKKPEDVHHKAGMQCVDCHISYEVMGDGTPYQHKEEAVKIQCLDCHNNRPRTVRFNNLDFESQKILTLRNKVDTSALYLKTEKGNFPLINTFSKNEQVTTELKANSKQLISKPPSFQCGRDINGHSRLDCKTCHTAWAPQCVGCHTNYDEKKQGWDYLANKSVNGSWTEERKHYFVDFPSLGIVKKDGKETISTFIPGMVLSIKAKQNNYFNRLFAPAFPHTITKKAATCKTCHNNPVALGYGRGELKYKVDNGKGKWTFVSNMQKIAKDNLPEDAWLGFLTNSTKNNSTRPNTRPFTIDEQRKILTIGACFSCHEESNKKVLNALSIKNNFLKKINKKCFLPRW